MPKIQSKIFLRSDFGKLSRGAFIILTSAFPLCVLSGCEVLGVVCHTLIGEPPVAAQYVPQKVPTLVFVDNPRNPDEVPLDSDQIAHQVGDELKKSAGLPLIDPDKLAPLREEDPTKFRAMSCQAIGKALGAKQVIYVDLMESNVTGDITQAAVHAHALAQVRVVDVATGNTLWPVNASHGTELEAKADYDPSDTSHAMSMRTDMLTSLSSRIAKLFHTWSPNDQDQENAGG